jgi:hypothetical protein
MQSWREILQRVWALKLYLLAVDNNDNEFLNQNFAIKVKLKIYNQGKKK